MTSPHDIHCMRYALGLARRGLGRTGVRPSVGCVLVQGAHTIAAARTGDGGSPHAEAAALKQAAGQTAGATAYVTLEPCSHHGQNPPCADALIEAGIERVVIACTDPNPKVNGQGIARLQAAGIKVETGVLEQEAKALHQGFFLSITEQRPLVTIKTATGSDGLILPGHEGEPQWVTGSLARQRAHLERSQHDAILVGIGTVLADDPMLTTRIKGLEHNIVRVVLDARLEVPINSKLVQSAADNPLWIFHTEDPENKKAALEQAGCRLFSVQDKSIEPILHTLNAEGVSRLLVEGGATIHGAFLEAGYVDRLVHFHSRQPVGARAQPAFNGFDINKVKSDFGLKHQKTAALGEDLLEIYAKPA